MLIYLRLRQLLLPRFPEMQLLFPLLWSHFVELSLSRDRCIWSFFYINHELELIWAFIVNCYEEEAWWHKSVVLLMSGWNATRRKSTMWAFQIHDDDQKTFSTGCNNIFNISTGINIFSQVSIFFTSKNIWCTVDVVKLWLPFRKWVKSKIFNVKLCLFSATLPSCAFLWVFMCKYMSENAKVVPINAKMCPQLKNILIFVMKKIAKFY